MRNVGFIIVYGITYSNFGVYGADVWNGVGAITDVDFNGTAEEYLPDNPMQNTSTSIRLPGTAMEIRTALSFPMVPGASALERMSRFSSSGGHTWKKLQKLDHPT